MVNRLLHLSPTCGPRTAAPSSPLLMAKTLELFSAAFIPTSTLSGNPLGPAVKIYAESESISNLLLLRSCSEPPALACYCLVHRHSLYGTQNDHFQIKVKLCTSLFKIPIVGVSLRMSARVLRRAEKALGDLPLTCPLSILLTTPLTSSGLLILFGQVNDLLLFFFLSFPCPIEKAINITKQVL